MRAKHSKHNHSHEESRSEHPHGEQESLHQGHGGEHGGHVHHDHKGMVEDFKRRFIWSSILTIPVVLLSPSIQEFLGYSIVFPGSQYVQWILSTIIYVYGGYPFIKGLVEELRKRNPGMMTLIGIAISVAYFYSTAVVFIIPGKTFFWELATLIDVMLLGHWIEMKSLLRASRALEELVKTLPTIAHLVKDHETVDVPVTEVSPGDIVLVKPGEKIPVDGIVVEGASSVNEAMITGEAKPVSKKPGSKVIAGTINIDGSLVVKALKTGKDTYLMQVIELVKKAQESKSRMQDLANRAARILTFIGIGAGTATLSFWLLYGYDFVFALERAVTVMVITCPHALGLAVPLVIARSTSIAAMHGLLIRNRVAFENARNLQAVVYDKTGTLTKGVFTVTDVVVLDEDYDEEQVLRIAASLEEKSEHPIAKSIVDYAKSKGIVLEQVEEFKAIPGTGVMGKVKGLHVMIVGPGYIREHYGEPKDPRILELKEQGKTIVYLVVENKLVAALALADEIRPEAFEAVEKLRERGIKTILLTGDNAKVAKWVAEKLGLDEYYAEVLPHEKAQVIKKIKEKGLVVAMVGDGVNDAPALVEADVGIAIGAGTDVAVESADIVLVRNDPRDIPALIDLASRTYRKIFQNLLWATGYNAIAIPLAAGVLYGYGILLPPAAGALLMSASTVIVAANSQLLK